MPLARLFSVITSLIHKSYHAQYDWLVHSWLHCVAGSESSSLSPSILFHLEESRVHPSPSLLFHHSAGLSRFDSARCLAPEPRCTLRASATAHERAISPTNSNGMSHPPRNPRAPRDLPPNDFSSSVPRFPSGPAPLPGPGLIEARVPPP